MTHRPKSREGTPRSSRATVPPQALACVRRWPSPAARMWAEQWVPEICAVREVSAVIVVGSCVRDVPVSSDLDLVVIYESTKPVFPTPPIDVDLRSYPKAKVEERIAAGHDFLGWAVRFGCLVCEHHSYWTGVRRKWAQRLPLPSPAVADKRAEQAGKRFSELKAMGDEDAAQEQRLAMLTHRARAYLIRAGIYPASRPELPAQLKSLGEKDISKKLEDTIAWFDTPREE